MITLIRKIKTCISMRQLYRCLSKSRILLALFVTLVAVSSVALRAVATPATRPPCGMHLRQIGLAILNYQDKRKALPPVCTTDAEGNPLHSWRTLVLPDLEEAQLFEQFELREPWNSPKNRSLSDTDIPIFHCPHVESPRRGETNYVAVIGPQTAWRRDKSVRAIPDGSRDTILLIETRSSGLRWAEPRDLDLDNLPPGITKDNLLDSLGNHGTGFFALFADGHYEFIPKDISWETFMAMLTINGGEKIERTW